MLPAVAVKLVEVAPEDTVTVTGTVKAAALLDRFTVTPPVRAAFDKVTEQVEVPAEIRLEGEQDTAVTVGLAIKAIEVVAELPL